MNGTAGEKTIEQQFLCELEMDFELAPVASRAVLATAQQVLLASAGEPRPGQMRVAVVSDREPSGKPLAAMRKVRVAVTVDAGLEDLEVLKPFGLGGQRRARTWPWWLRNCDQACRGSSCGSNCRPQRRYGCRSTT